MVKSEENSNNIFTILVIDDDTVIRKILETVLHRAGYKVMQAENGTEGFNLALHAKPELILLDVSLPDESGFEVIKRLKQANETTKIPVIFITGNADITSKVEGFKLGAVDYIVKPLQVEEVQARVNLHIKLSQAINLVVLSQAEQIKNLKKTQQAMMVQPNELAIAKFDVFYKPLNEAGGDIYDVFQMSEAIFGYFVGDVSGHDIGTSLITASVKALLKQNCKLFNTPLESIEIINSVLYELLAKEQYLTACYVLVNRIANKMSVISMGHPPILFVPNQGEPLFVRTQGAFLGMFEDTMFESKDLKVNPGDRFIVYTDGLLEGINAIGWKKNKAKLLELAIRYQNLPLTNLSAKIHSQLSDPQFQTNDDITILCAEI